MKKLLIGAAMLAAMVFTSCMPDAIKADGTIKYDNSYVIIEEDGSVKQGKEGKEGSIENKEWYYREIEDSAFKHFGGTCTIKINKNFDTCGNAGFIFGLTRNEDKTVNFGVVTITVQDSKLNYYISLFKNVDLKKGYSKNSSFSDKDGNKIETMEDFDDFDVATGGAEYQITPRTGIWKEITNADLFLDEDDNYSVKISVVADDLGSYDIQFFGEEEDAIFNHEISNNYTGLEEKTQTEFGYYAMIRPGKKFEAKIDLVDYEGNPIPVYY